MAALAGGCTIPQPPSSQKRRASFEHLRGEIRGNPDEWKRRTYLVFSGGPEFRLRVNKGTGAIEFTGAADGFSIGMGAGLTGNGSIVTSAHVLRSVSNVHVFGWLSGTTSSAPARVVFQQQDDGHAGVAVLQVDAVTQYFSDRGSIPEPGTAVFAVVCHRDGSALALDLAGGRVIGPRNAAPDAVLSIITSDLPLISGDSGGPLISAEGRLLGINAGITYGVRDHWSDSVGLNTSLLEPFLRWE